MTSTDSPSEAFIARPLLTMVGSRKSSSWPRCIKLCCCFSLNSKTRAIASRNTLSTKVVLAQDADQRKKFIHFPEVEDGAIVQFYQAGALIVKGCDLTTTALETERRRKLSKDLGLL
ncbi:hypothetical protein DMENIID0001_050010 [Sergentomyia squamirostris]